MISFPNAKINIGLYITQKRKDGYHEIETILYPIPFRDAIEIRKSSEAASNLKNLGITIDDIPVAETSVMKAYKLLQQDYSLPPLDIILYKNIPFGAGLGGGSADAAFMLKLLNEYFDLQLSIEKLENYAAQLGSDDPFFIRNTPQLATGRGEKLKPINLSLQGYYLVLLKPDIKISTALAYQSITPSPANFDLDNLANLPITQWQDKIYNHFEAGLFTHFPVLSKLKTALYNSGAIYTSLSGSGSALYGIFKEKPLLDKNILENIIWEGVL